MPMAPGNATSANWLAFNQSEFQGNKQVGFGELGWVYVPSRCQNLNDEGPGSAPCKLVVRPGKCSPRTADVTPDVAEFANYAEGNGLVLLHPCLGGPVDKSFHAPDVAAGMWDVYGQLGPNYVHQSAPHMRAVGEMIRRVLGKGYAGGAGVPPTPPPPPPPTPPPPPFSCTSPPAACTTQLEKLDDGKACCGCRAGGDDGRTVSWSDETRQLLEAPEACPAACMAAPPACAAILACPGVCHPVTSMPGFPLPALKITGGVLTAGCSNTGDFAEQFHVAFSSIVRAPSAQPEPSRPEWRLCSYRATRLSRCCCCLL
jgi:hypothetical protein